MVADIDTKNKLIIEKNEKIKFLQSKYDESSALKEKLAQYEKMESTLNQAIIMAQKTSDQLKTAAYKERDIILDDAKKNASRIVNDALMKAEKIENDADVMKRNINVLKRRLKNIIESQLEIIDDIDKLDM